MSSAAFKCSVVCRPISGSAVDRARREFQFLQEQAQVDHDALQARLLDEFGRKVLPIIEDIRAERQLWAVLSPGEGAGPLAVDPALDLSAEVVRRRRGGADHSGVAGRHHLARPYEHKSTARCPIRYRPMTIALEARRTAWLVTLGAVCAISPGTAVWSQTPTFRAEARTVAIHATVQDSDGRLVPDLERGDFRLFVDSSPVTITQFSNDPQPLRVALMLDTSAASGNGLGSFDRVVRDRNRDAILGFVDALRPDDRVRVGSFGLEIAIGGNLTRDRAEVERVLREELWIGGGTPLWQALVAGMQSLESEPGRRVVLVVTNGVDTGRLPGFVGRRSNVDDYSRRTDTMVYAVRMPPTPGRRDQLTDAIKEVAEASGGGHFDVPPDADVRKTFIRIAEELRHQYLIGFVPAVVDGQVHQVEVRPVRSGLTIRSRRTFAAGDP